MTAPFIRTVTLKNYKSIAGCRVELQNLMFLVGPNGAGKSNFLDSIKFVADSLTNGLDHALRERGTIKEVRRRSGGHPTHFSIRFDFQVPRGPEGHYSFRVGAKPNGEFEVQEEECSVVYPDDVLNPHGYRVKSGEVLVSSSSSPALISDRLALVNFAGTTAFRPVFDALSRIEIYNLNPKEIAAPQKIDPSDQLRRDGSNAASILRQAGQGDVDMINQYLGKIVPGIREVNPLPLGSFETMEFRQEVKGQRDPWRFLASSMSDGTLRSFGILLAAMQSAATGPLLLGLEEPETAVHPAAARVLLQALRSASTRRQIVVTSHSPDLLDDPDISEDSLLSVLSRGGTTLIGPIDAASKTAVREHLFTPGELLRQGQITVAKEVEESRNSESQLHFFEVDGS